MGSGKSKREVDEELAREEEAVNSSVQVFFFVISLMCFEWFSPWFSFQKAFVGF